MGIHLEIIVSKRCDISFVTNMKNMFFGGSSNILSNEFADSLLG